MKNPYIYSEQADEIDDPPNRKKPDVAGVLKWVVPLLFSVVILLIFLYQAFLSTDHSVHLVNGAGVAYTVEIDGQPYPMQVGQRQVVTLSEGEHTVAIVSSGQKTNEETFVIQSTVWDRLLGNNTFVINADQAAVIYTERIGYYLDTSKPIDPADDNYEFRVHTGDVLYQYGDMDFYFTEFPEVINMGSQQPVKERSRVNWYPNIKPAWAHQMISTELDETRANSYLRHRFTFNPDDEDLLYLLQQSMTEQEYFTLIEPFCERRPVLVECHRSYQESKLRMDPDIDLLPQYRSLLEEDPANPRLQYLVARLLEDQSEMEVAMRQAADHPDSTIHPHHTLYYIYLSTARFPEALQEALVMQTMFPKDDHFAFHVFEAQTATEDLEAANKSCARWCALDPSDGYRVQLRMVILKKIGWDQNSELVIKKYLRDAARRGVDDSVVQDWETLFEAWRLRLNGNRRGYAETLGKIESDFWKCKRFLVSGNTREAEAHLGKMDDPDVDLMLTLALSYFHQGRHDNARRMIAEVIQLFENSDRLNRKIAEWLRDPKKADSDEVLHSSLHPEIKVLVLSVLGFEDKAHRNQYFQLARQLNFMDVFPSRLVDEILAEHR